MRQAVKMGTWIVITELSTLILYQEVITRDVTLIERLDFVALCGAGYYVATFFFLKYFVVYGVSSWVITMDGILAPRNPKCTTLVYLYSDMWRSFDVGLYDYCSRFLN